MAIFDRAGDLTKVGAGPLAPVENAPQEPEEEEELQMTLVEHLDELRKRLIVCAIGLAIGTALAFPLVPFLLQSLIDAAPAAIKENGLVFVAPAEAFLMYFQISLMTGIGLSSPVLIWQLIGFVLPALTRREKRLLYAFLPLVLVFFLVGISFGYFVTLPFALRYLLEFTLGGIFRPLITADNYLSFVTTILFWMGVAFETPIVIFFLSKIGVVNTARLTAFRKYAILVAFVIAAVITPTPDPLNQALVAIPLWILYEIGIILARFS